MELYDTNQDEQILINDVLVQERHAIKCPEPYRSMVCINATPTAKSLT